MERGIYFDGWFPAEHCYHPSMPPRRLTMLDDLADMGATILVWAGLGGGSISLPYLEEEAFGPVPERFRQHGFVNDSEFARHARERGIDQFGIVFEAQAWEFPAEVVDGEVLAQNIVRGAAPSTTLGLREFSQDAGPASWKPFRHYFPEGLVNSDGEQVEDLWEEVACRDLEGRALHAHWVEVSGKGQSCYLAERNNPVWREYLKAVIRIQIDAGVPGVQLDETDVPLMALRYGGCFCKDCMKGMRRHLQSLPEPPEQLAGVDLATFDYRRWLLAQGFAAGTAPQLLPLYEHYVRFQVLEVARTFRELAEYVREYAASVGRTVRVAGNFFDCAPYYDAMVEHVDVLVTEMRETRYQQPWYFRHGVGLSRGRPLVAVENPYGGVTEDLLRRIQRGKARDLFRLSIYEANAMGGNMALPYGSWLGTEVKDSYWVPRDLAVEVGQFVKSLDPVTSDVSTHRTAVVYSVASMLRDSTDSDQFSDGGRWFEHVEARDAHPASYWQTIEHLSRSGRTFDVVVLPDEEQRATDVTADSLARYDVLVVPDAWNLSAGQHRLLADFLERGGRVVVHGAYATQLPPQVAAEVLGHERTIVVEAVGDVAGHTTQDVVGAFDESLAVSVHALADGSQAVHVVNFAYDEALDAVRERRDVELGLRTDRAVRRAVLHAPGAAPAELQPRHAAGVVSVTVPVLGPYVVVHLD